MFYYVTVHIIIMFFVVIITMLMLYKMQSFHFCICFFFVFVCLAAGWIWVTGWMISTLSYAIVSVSCCFSFLFSSYKSTPQCVHWFFFFYSYCAKHTKKNKLGWMSSVRMFACCCYYHFLVIIFFIINPVIVVIAICKCISNSLLLSLVFAC